MNPNDEQVRKAVHDAIKASGAMLTAFLDTTSPKAMRIVEERLAAGGHLGTAMEFKDDGIEVTIYIHGYGADVPLPLMRAMFGGFSLRPVTEH